MGVCTLTKRIHFIGIGGSGMSGIAEVLIKQGYRVSGSDHVNNLATSRLAQMGATIYQGHDPSYIEGADVVVTSTAIAADNVELLSAHAQHIPVMRRVEKYPRGLRVRRFNCAEMAGCV